MSTQARKAREHVSTQGMVSTKGTRARKKRWHVSTQDSLAREHARHVGT